MPPPAIAITNKAEPVAVKHARPQARHCHPPNAIAKLKRPAGKAETSGEYLHGLAGFYREILERLNTRGVQQIDSRLVNLSSAQVTLTKDRFSYIYAKQYTLTSDEQKITGSTRGYWL